MSKEPLAIRLSFCLAMLTVGLLTLAASAVLAAVNLSAGRFDLFGVNSVSAVLGAATVAANVFFVASAAIRHYWLMRL